MVISLLLALWLRDHTDNAATGCNTGFSMMPACEGNFIHVEIGCRVTALELSGAPLLTPRKG
jgi:hypothetical protein